MAKLSDCLGKAVAGNLLTEDESAFVQRRAKEFPGMSRQEAEIAAARSMLQDGVTELKNIRNQLGLSKPISEPKVILRTANKEAALVAMMDETQAVVENEMIKQAQALQGDEAVMQTAQQQTEAELIGVPRTLGQTPGRTSPRPVDREAEITVAVERLNKMPGERIGVYQKIRDTLLQTMRANRIEIAGMEFERGMSTAEREAAGITKVPKQHEIAREKMLAAMGELNALLKFLPPVVRGKVGGFFQLAKGGLGETELSDFFTQRIKMVEREVERLLRNDYKAQIEKLLKSSAPVAGPNKIQKSKIGESQAAVDIARGAASMTAEKAAQELASIESQLTNPDLTDEQQSVLQGQWAIVNAFGDLAHRNAETLSTAHAWLTDTVARGRSEWEEKEEARLEKVRGWATGITEGLPPVTQAGTASLEWEQKMTQLGDSFILSHFSFAQALEHLLPEGNALTKRWSDKARKADNASQDFIRAASDRLTERVKEAIQSDNRLKVGNALWHLKQVVDGPIPMTRLQAIQSLMSWNQPEVRERMEKTGWTQKQADWMQTITEDDLSQSITEFLREEYEKGYQTINKVYRRMYGMDMPRVLNYAPTAYHHAGSDQDIGLYGGPLAVSGVTPSFAKTRTHHSAQIRPTDALQVYWQHMAQMAHWTNYAELLREMRGVLGKPEVKLALKQRYGLATTQILDKWVDALARQGGNKASELQVVDKFLEGLISAKAVSSLGLNLRSVVMQGDAIMRAMIPIPMRRIARALADPKFIETIPQAWHSDTIQRRVQNGASPEARYLFERARAKPSVMMELARISMLPIQLMDGYLTSFSSAIVFRDAYNEAKEQGMDEEQATATATDAMDDAVYRFSQPMGIANRSLAEVSGNRIFKMFMMFMSDPRLKTAVIADSLRSLVTGKGDAGTHLRRIFAIEVFAMLSQVLSNWYRDAFSDDDEDEIWTWQGFAKAGLLPMLSGWLFLGTVGEVGISALLNERAFVPSRDPLVEAAQRAVRAKSGFNNIVNTNDPAAMLKEWDNIARSLVLLGPLAGPTAAVPAVVVNFLKPIIGSIENSQKKE